MPLTAGDAFHEGPLSFITFSGTDLLAALGSAALIRSSFSFTLDFSLGLQVLRLFDISF